MKMLFAIVLLAAAADAQVSETITVTATRRESRVADTPASVVVLSDEDLASTAAPTLDDALRQVAGFTLFRRTGSRVANPTAQGVTLRGVGASGASRALVLDDGVPLNDPFGGWVYWGRVPRVSVERAEVLRGGASDLYGSSAMGGVIQFIRRKNDGLRVEASGGSHGTAMLSAFTAGASGAWSGSLAVELFSTRGHVLVRPEERGAVDVEANSQHVTVDGTVHRGSLFLRASHYTEERENGTPQQTNDTVIRHVSIGGDGAARGGAISGRAWISDQDYFQTFSAIAAGRDSERLTVEQRVPSRGGGGTLQCARGFGARHAVVTGLELRTASGTSDEIRFTPNGTFHLAAGGTQRTAAAFVEDVLAINPSLSVTAGIRSDWWRNEGQELSSTEGQVNPRLSVLWRAGDALAFSGSAYTAFRAPTLNELYRGFRVGNIETLPNAALRAENLTGFEAGVRARSVRLTLFLMNVLDTVANVTLSEGPGGIIRRRENVGRTRSMGAELDMERRWGRDLRLSASWLFVDATVREGQLRDRRVPQVPRHQATAQLTWKRAGAQARWSAMQFDDDRNELRLKPYLVVDLFASHPLTATLHATFAIENAFDSAVETAASPVITLGQPRAWRIGLRYAR